MFGGYGLYKDGVIFGIIANDELYFKVDDTNKQRYESAGSHPFMYEGHKSRKPMAMSYWLVETEDKELLTQMVEESYQISLANKKSKTRSRKKGL